MNRFISSLAGVLLLWGWLPSYAAPTNTTAALSPTNAAALPPVGQASYSTDDKRILRPGDKLSFQILEDRDKPVPLVVTESSELDFPYIGRVSVEDKTCKQAAEIAKKLLEQDYYYTATVVLGLDQMNKVVGKVYVIGPVRQPGAVEIPANENFTAGKAILRAGGFGDFANKKNVQIIRKTPTGNTSIKVNMVEVLEKGNIDADVTLENGDFIIVSERSINF
jgi:polysaccharide biosynthesis/export protein